jgi:hypothetical protein
MAKAEIKNVYKGWTVDLKRKHFRKVEGLIEIITFESAAGEDMFQDFLKERICNEEKHHS